MEAQKAWALLSKPTLDLVVADQAFCIQPLEPSEMENRCYKYEPVYIVPAAEYDMPTKIAELRSKLDEAQARIAELELHNPHLLVDEYAAKNGYRRMCPTCGREQ